MTIYQYALLRAAGAQMDPAELLEAQHLAGRSDQGDGAARVVLEIKASQKLFDGRRAVSFAPPAAAPPPADVR